MKPINGLSEKANATLARMEQIRDRRKAFTYNDGKPLLIEHNKFSGDNWLVCSMQFGNSGINDKDYYINLTTDRIRCSEYTGDAKTDAEFLAHANVDVADLLNLAAEMHKALSK